MKRKLGLLVIAALLLVGCSLQRVMIEPVVTVGGSNTIAVIFFDNFTSDYAISHEVEQKLVKTLSEYYRVIEPAETEGALVQLGLLRGQSPDRDQVVRLGQILEVDAIVMGEVAAYFAPVNQMPPYKGDSRMGDGGLEHQWEVVQNTQAMVGFTGRVMDTRSGNVIHRLRVEGEGSEQSRDIIANGRWFEDGSNIDFWIPRPSNRDISSARRVAVQESVRRFTADLLPTYQWQRN